MALFEDCYLCQECCIADHECFEVFLTPEEQARLGREKLWAGPNMHCPMWTPDGCSLSERERPFECRLYPLHLYPGDVLSIDLTCRNAWRYMYQLMSPDSDAAKHLREIREELKYLPDSYKEKVINVVVRRGYRPVVRL